jgi:hypothetical protein
VVWVGVGAGQVGDQERPAGQAEELDERGEHTDRRGDREQRGSAPSMARQSSKTSGTMSTAVSSKAHQVSTCGR